ncbi:3'(2'),5'-bisphosphate nucleotidase 1-like [Watersipora subatra]|uniref:3'(2'),5'-bisphosphate nucleotidase 1-like n=1 Tax=Watersipora subatra TaxID=2589382 RepID=UPI00355B32DB
MASVPTVLRLLAASVKIAEKSGNIVRRILSSGELGIVEKENVNDLQTEADRTVQRCIVSSLYHNFPKLTVIGEEDDLDETVDKDIMETGFADDVMAMTCPEKFVNAPESELVMWVDPLDGTKEFTQGLLDHVTVLIGLSWQGKAIGGVIHQPYFNYQNKGAELGRTIYSLNGLGVFGLTDKKPPTEGNIIATTRSHSNKAVNDSIEACEPTEVLRVGGAGHKVMLLLDGVVHAYVFASPGCKKWDTCAPEAILKEKGGTLTDMHGSDLQYHKEVQRQNTGGVLATLHSDHSWYLNRIPASVKEALNPVKS